MELEQFLPGGAAVEGWPARSGSQPFPEALRAFAVRYVEHVQKAGGTIAQASEKLGVSEPTLYAWCKGKPAGRPRAMAALKSAALVPVRMGEGKAAAGAELEGLQQVALASPGGWRVEGLSLEAAAELLGKVGC